MTRENGSNRPGEQGDVQTLKCKKTKRPPKYAVIMHNDDYTTQEFVVMVLVQFFYKTIDEAYKLMLTVHMQGKAKVGVYTKDVAQTKVQIVISCARENGMPLMVSAESE